MSPLEQYENAIGLATGMARVTTREKVSKSTWCPFQLLYVEMAKRKEIPTLTELPEDEKRKYWNEAKKSQAGEMKWRQMWVAQALYLYDLITHENDNNDKTKAGGNNFGLCFTGAEGEL